MLKKVKATLKLLMGNPWQSYGASLAIRDHLVLPAGRDTKTQKPGYKTQK